GRGAARGRADRAFDPGAPALTHPGLVLAPRPPVDLDLRYDGVNRHRPTPAGSITLVPAGSPVWARSSGHKDELHIFLQAGLVTRVAAEAVDLHPGRVAGPPPGGPGPPPPRGPVGGGGGGLTARGGGGPPGARGRGHRPARPPDPPRPDTPEPCARAGRNAAAGAAPRRRRVHRGAPRRQPEPGAAGRGGRPQRLPLRAAVQEGHRAAAAPVRHPAPR